MEHKNPHEILSEEECAKDKIEKFDNIQCSTR